MLIAVTGASGHVGSNLCPLLLAQGHRLRVLVHRKRDHLNDPACERVQGDLTDPDAMDRLVQGADAVYHLAARISIDSARDPLVQRVNVDGTRNVVEACVRHGVKRLVHFSSIHSYRAKPRTGTLDESRGPTEELAPAYDRSKAAGDAIVLQAVREHGLNAVILAPTSVFGPNDHGPSLLGQAIADIHHGRIPLLAPGGYDFVDVRDVAQAAVHALTQGAAGEKFLLSGHYYSVKDLAAAIGQATGKKAVQRVAPAWLLFSLVPFFRAQAWLTHKPALLTREAIHALLEGHPRISCAKAERILSFHRRPFEESISETLAWLEASPAARAE
ncbi:MAG: NAD-dependent epimerase/dehydratase family protein [Flavobacteriales bacterium]|nr:NAD-dependent epimerase/dehydratase family protein [Flavobacteriales bacterium]MBK7754275.1 NAD-dependent epimerase/dehydratase family protein [Flavobacteriales bacterium]MBK9074814.1 NAD-dependent epimerase/dehydratase family protein [Flavobacteriales bacterium]